MTAFVATIATKDPVDDTGESGQAAGARSGDTGVDEHAWQLLLLICAMLLALDTLLSNRLSRPLQET